MKVTFFPSIKVNLWIPDGQRQMQLWGMKKMPNLDETSIKRTSEMSHPQHSVSH